MAEAPIVEILGAVTALFLSVIILSAVSRQATKKSFQKRALLSTIILLMSAVVSNILITIYMKQPAPDTAAMGAALILSKNIQATFDLLFAITIGVFVLATANAEIDSLTSLKKYLLTQFPNSFVFYVFVQVLAIATVWTSGSTVSISQSGVIRFEFPAMLLFMLALASVTVLIYVPVLLLSYVRQNHARPSVVRDLYMIILGVSGYTGAEFVVEVVLPFYGLDVRAVGFILEMALIGLVAYAVRERGFLENLLVPQAEADLQTAPAFALERGQTYLVLEDGSAHSFDIFRDLVTHGAEGLCITRKPPKDVMLEYGLEKTPILWLSRIATMKNCVRPSPPENVAMAVEHFIDVGKDCVILLDGLEYLVAHNDFSSVLALLHDLNENVSIHDSILLLPLDARAMTEREFALVRREVRTITPPERPPAKLLPRVEVEVSKGPKKPRSP